ncbi:MAG: non-ribosomal peptide synthetase [Candidatus Omnitrophota bacterium]
MECLQDLIEAQCQKTPQATALIFHDQQWTYDDLNRRANKIAHYLKKLGAGPEVLVAVFLDRGSDLVCGLLGVLKSGSAYIPLDPIFPANRIAAILNDARPLLILTEEKLKGMLPAIAGSRRVLVDTDSSQIHAQPETNLPRETDARNLAYAIYTSGSTGNPKGVLIEHGGLVNFMRSMAREPGLGPDDVFAALTTITFDIAAMEIFLPLTVGAAVALINRETAGDGTALKEIIDQLKPTVIQATPSTWRLLLEADWNGRRGLKMLVGGEALPRVLADALIVRGEVLWNMYGPTETTIWSSAGPVSKERKITLGKPIANTAFYVLDPEGKPIASGEGELYIGGAGLARAYLNRPELSAEKFLPDPFRKIGRMYRTGDLVRILADGELEFLGRADHQVKIAGFRIELSEIEAKLLEHPSIRAAIVQPWESPSGDKKLTAYFISQGEPPTTSELHRWLKTCLPAYMVPSFYIAMEHFPLMPNGKLDRRALPSPDISRPALDESYIAPGNAIEKGVARIWTEILAVERPGVLDNFFELGGTSLQAFALTRKLEKVYSVKFPVAALIRHPTIRAMALFLSQGGMAASDSVLGLKPSGDKPPLFCIPGLGGDVICFQRLSECFSKMDPVRPIYGLQTLDFFEKNQFENVKDIAAQGIRAIRKVQSKGPYHFIGYSFGGLVAYEMAQQLLRLGENTTLLCMVDTYAPRAFSSLGSNLRFIRKSYRTLAPALRPRFLRNLFIGSRRAAAQTLRTYGYRLLSGMASKRVRNVLYTGEGRIKMIEINYDAKPYPGTLTLLRSEERERIHKYRICRDNVLGWSGLVRKAVVFPIGGTHMETLREPYAEGVAAQLIRSLEMSGCS